jgi:hypothetical protein
MQGTDTDDYDAMGKGSNVMGKGAKFARPVTPEGAANRNKASLSPNGGLDKGNADESGYPTNKGVDASSDTPGEEDFKESFEMDITDFVNALFEGQNLSEDFKQKAAVIFESALNQKVSLIEQAILEASEEVIQEQVSDAVGVITEKVDEYLGYVITEWMDENKLQVEQGFRTEIAENFIMGLKDLFENNFIEVPEDKVDLVDELFAENRQLEESINELMKKNMELAEQNLVNECAAAFLEMSSGLADTEVEKLASLTEGLDFNDVETYKNKIAVLKESYFGEKAPANSSQSMITEETSVVPPVTNDEMSMYVHSISKHLKGTNKKS